MENRKVDDSWRMPWCEGPSVIMLTLLVLALITSNLTGCMNRNIRELDPGRVYDGQYLLVHEDGYAFKPEEGEYFRSTDEFGAYLDKTVKPKIDEFLNVQESNPGREACRGRLRILIFVHGGLNTYEAAFERIQKLWPSDSEGGLKRSCYFPIFVNWNSDLLTSLQDDFFRVRFGRTDKALSVVTSPFLLVRRMLESVGSLPLSLIHNYLNIRESQEGGWEEGDPVVCIVGDTLLHLPLHAFYIGTIPFLEGFGGGSWQIMKRRAELAVASNLEDPPGEEYAIIRPLISPYNPFMDDRPEKFRAEGAVRTFIRRFRNWLTLGNKNGREFVGWQNGKEVVPIAVTLVGHSAGSLMVNRMLAMADEVLDKLPPLPLAHVVHAGPVAPIHEWDDFVIPYLTRNSSSGAMKPDFSIFNLNRRDEVREMPANWAFFMPRGSLVPWVDIFLQRASTLGQSTSGWEKNVKEYFRVDNKRGVAGICCFEPSWDPANGPAPEQQPLKVQYKRLRINPPTPLTQEQFKVFKAPRRLGAQNVPRTHSDFDEPNFLLELLCHMDDQDFKDPKFCDHPPDWISMKSP